MTPQKSNPNYVCWNDVNKIVKRLENSENLKRRVNSTEGLFIDEDGNLNAQSNRIKNGTKPLDNDDLRTKQCTVEIIGKLGEDLRKVITQNINY